MLPQYKRLNDEKTKYVRVPFGKMALLDCSLPLGAFVFCVFWSLLFEFERATFTHCDVINLLPSISAAIGSFEPQRSVWQIAIALHLPVRFVCIKLYSKYFSDTIRKSSRSLVKFACALSFLENIALLILSLWTSSDSYEIHRNAFVTFIACSEIYMLTSYLLLSKARRLPLLPVEEKSLLYKRRLFLLNVTAFTLAGYCFLRHNDKCEPMMYTYFALFEYIVVLSNMAYHMTSYWDFYNIHVNFDWQQGFYLTEF